MKDSYGRVIEYLRLSLTEQCNLRCQYCMPPGSSPVPEHPLTIDEILRLGRIFHSLGVRKFRLTGGEPLLRKDLPQITAGLATLPGSRVYLTTNGVLLEEALPALVSSGLSGVNISLDTVDPGIFSVVTGRDLLPQVLGGIRAAVNTQSLTVKINCVPTARNRDGLLPLMEYFSGQDIALRFIELMPIGQGKKLTGIPEAQLRDWIEALFGPLVPASQQDCGPAVYYRAPGFQGKIGFISALSCPFCGRCNRVRLTADGLLKTCLQFKGGLALRPLLTQPDEAVAAAILAEIRRKPKGHHFGASSDPGDETRAMHQIGG